MTKAIQGRIRGKTIELTEDLGLAEGQPVEVFVRALPTRMNQEPGQGLLRTEGALIDDPHWDMIMDDVYRERKNDSRREIRE